MWEPFPPSAASPGAPKLLPLPRAPGCTAAFFIQYGVLFSQSSCPGWFASSFWDVHKRGQQYLNIPLGAALDTVLSKQQGHGALLELVLRCEMWASVSSVRCEVLFPSFTSVLWSNVMVCITILSQGSKHHIHLQDRRKVVKPSEEQRIDLSLPSLLWVFCALGLLPFGFIWVTQRKPQILESPVQCQKLFKKQHMGASLSLAIWISFPDLFCWLLRLFPTYTLHFERNKRLIPSNQRTPGSRIFIKTKASQNSSFNSLSSNLEAGSSVSQASPYNSSLQIYIRGWKGICDTLEEAQQLWGAVGSLCGPCSSAGEQTGAASKDATILF